jgi:hypothetical protein
MNAIEIVVCRCKEQPTWIEPWSRVFPITVFDKGDTTLLKPGLATVIKRPNVGREVEAWFHFLSHLTPSLSPTSGGEGEERYSRHTIFLQAEPGVHAGENAMELIAKLTLLAAQDAPYAPVSNTKLECDEDGEPHHPGLPIKKVWGLLWPDRIRPDKITFYAGGQFIVRDDVIAQYLREFWVRGLNLCNKEANPLEAYVMERLWHTIWMDAVEKIEEARN